MQNTRYLAFRSAAATRITIELVNGIVDGIVDGAGSSGRQSESAPFSPW